MGISIVSAAPVSVSPIEAAGLVSTDASAIDFAALLTQQLGPTAQLGMDQIGSGKELSAGIDFPGGKEIKSDKDLPVDPAIGADAGLVAALAASLNPLSKTLAPPPPSNNDLGLGMIGQELSDGADPGILSLLANGRKPDGKSDKDSNLLTESLSSGQNPADPSLNAPIFGLPVTAPVTMANTGQMPELQASLPSYRASFGLEQKDLGANLLLATGEQTGKGSENIADSSKPVAAAPSDFAANLAAQSSLATPSSHTTKEQAPASLQVATPLQDPHWSQDFSERIVWAARNDQHVAQININPPQLGPVQITLTVNGDQVTASFVSAHGEVRQAIEDSLPRLRELFSGAGINLGDANVGAQQQQPGGDKAQQFSGSGRESPRFADDNAILRASSQQITTPAPSALQRGRGLVDLFA